MFELIMFFYIYGECLFFWKILEIETISNNRNHRNYRNYRNNRNIVNRNIL